MVSSWRRECVADSSMTSDIDCACSMSCAYSKIALTLACAAERTLSWYSRNPSAALEVLSCMRSAASRAASPALVAVSRAALLARLSAVLRSSMAFAPLSMRHCSTPDPGSIYAPADRGVRQGGNAWMLVWFDEGAHAQAARRHN